MNKSKKGWLLFGKVLSIPLLVIGMAIIGYLLLVVNYAMPRERMIQKLSTPIERVYESNYTQFMDRDNSALDGYTDFVELLIAVHPSERGVWKDALMAPYLVKDNNQSAYTIDRYYIHGEVQEDMHVETYERYWHGYLLYLRPLLSLFNYGEIRGIIMLFHMVMYTVLILLFRKRCPEMIIPYSMFWLFLNPVSTMLSMQFSSCLLIIYVGLLAILYFDRRWSAKDLYRWGVLFLILGVLTNYFDYLTYPLATLGIPLLLLLLLQEEWSLPRRLLDITVYAGLWAVGYAGMWCMKWILGSMITGENVIANAREQASMRSGMYYNGVGFSYLGIIKKNLLSSINPAWILPMAVILVSIVYLLIRYKSPCLQQLIIFLVVASFPLLWIAGFSEHSYSHSYFAYRAWGGSVCAACSYGMVLWRNKKRKPN